ncbi:TonB family protein [Pseudophaeobacter sp.]|uniref:energy transducer TonB family protein n=1 Tax=Pseudophaeobacter sp. TaxID=1971739 RepID=UPI003298B3E4
MHKAPVLEVPQSHLAAVLALLLAFGLHAVFAYRDQGDPVQQAGGNTALASQGSSFANMAAGVETPEQVDVQKPMVETAQTPKLEPIIPQKNQPSLPPQAIRPPQTEPLSPTSQIEPVAGGVPLLAAVQEAAQAVPPEDLSVVAPAAVPAPSEVKEPVLETISSAEVPLDPVQSEAAEAATTQLQPPEPQSPAVTQSLRPIQRPTLTKPEPSRAEPTQPTTPSSITPRPNPAPPLKPTAQAQPRGNGEVNATRGAAGATGQQPGGQATTAGGTAKVQGNAAVNNYPGQVMRRIQRAKRRSNVRGVAIVRFSIAASGGLAGASLARSSGSAKLDGIALAQVRRAAPFPPPPPGARTSFTVRIKGN